MAAPKQAVPSPQIYTSDPVEQIHAKGLTDLDTGGLSYAFLNAARGDRARVQETYNMQLREANKLTAALGAQENDTELLKTLLTTAAPMANAGIDPSTMPIQRRLYADPTGELTRAPSGLQREKTAAEIAKLRADAAHTAAGGGGGAVQFQVDQDYGPNNSVGNRKETFKGKDPAAVAAAAAARAQANAAPGTGTVIRGDGTVGPPTTADARAAALPPGVPGAQVGQGSGARAQGEARRQAEARAAAEARVIAQRLDRERR